MGNSWHWRLQIAALATSFLVFYSLLSGFAFAQSTQPAANRPGNHPIEPQSTKKIPLSRTEVPQTDPSKELSPEDLDALEQQIEQMFQASVSQPESTPSFPNTITAIIGELSLLVRSYPDMTLVEYRQISDGALGSITANHPKPNIKLEGFRIETEEFVPFTEQDASVTIVALLAERTSDDLKRSIDFIEHTALNLKDEGITFILLEASDQPKIIAEINSTAEEDAIKAAFAIIRSELKPSRADSEAVFQAFQFLIDRQSSAAQTGSASRGAFLAPADLFPKDREKLGKLPEAANGNAISAFPYKSSGPASTAEEISLAQIAGQTGGRFLTPEIDDLPSGPASAFVDLFSGGVQSFIVSSTDAYRLPGQNVPLVKLSVATANVQEPLTLSRQVPTLAGKPLFINAVTPDHWLEWLSNPQRRRIGIYVLLAHIALVMTLATFLLKTVKRKNKLLLSVPDLEFTQHVNRLPLRIGRSDDMDVTLDHPSVSREHAIIEGNQGTGYTLKDVDSTNGIWVRNKQVQEHVLKSSDNIRIGSLLVRIIIVDQD